MNKTLYSIGIVYLGIAALLFADDSDFTIGVWGDFCEGAFTHTFDDNTPNQIKIAQPLFDAEGFHMTLFTITGSNQFPVDWEDMINASAMGHEIASHSVTHGQPMSDAELKTSRDMIREHIPGEMCVSVAYPYCRIPTESEVAKCYVAGRVCDNRIVPQTPPDFYRISSFLAGGGNLSGAEAFNRKAEDAVKAKGWCILLHHGVGNGDHISCNTAIADLEGNIEYLANNRDRIWVESFGNVVRYIKERDATLITVLSSSENECIIQLSDDLPDSVFNFPLSIRRELPQHWEGVEVTQNGLPVEDSIVTTGAKKYMMFKAVPDAGEVAVRNSGVVHSCQKVQKNTVQTGVPFRIKHRVLIINTRMLGSTSGSLTLFTLTGKVITRYRFNEMAKSFSLPVGVADGSVVIASISDGCGLFSKQLIL